MFNFNKEVDSAKEKLFLMKRCDVEERIDPEYYRPRHYRDLERLEKSPYKFTTLDKICSRIVDGPFGSAIKASDYVEEGVPFIRVADVTRGEGTIKTQDMIFITEQAHKRIIRSKVVPGDVVIAKTGATMGAASVIPSTLLEANIRGDLGALTTSDDVLPEFVVAFINTKIGQRFFWRLNSGGTRGRVVIGNLKKYPILVPPKEVQTAALEKMNFSYTDKRKKVAQARSVLDGIDGYLLKELKIKIPKKEYTNIFVTKFSEIGDRFNCSYHKPEYKVFDKAFYGIKVPVVSLGRISKVICGPFGSSITTNDYSETGTPLIRISNIDSEGRLSSDNIIYIPNKLAEKLSAYKVYENDLIISQRGSLGLISVVTKELSGSLISANLIAVKNINTISPDYLQVILGSIVGRTQIERKISGQVQVKITTEDVKSLSIPIIDSHDQEKIVQSVKSTRQQARNLLIESAYDLEKSMDDVERMILGDL